MYITLETDYAIRIVDTLARSMERLSAKNISDSTHVTLRFSLKILRKLVADGIIRSYKGTRGGYELNRNPREISLNDILECIEGPYVLNRCVREEKSCGLNLDKHCPYHYFFEHISHQVRSQLQAVTIDKTISDVNFDD